MRKHHFLIIIQFTILIYCMFFFVSKFHTYAWFTSEIRASGQITNATTEDLLSISTSNVSYLENCEISMKVIIRNISDMEIPIKLVDQNQLLKPGETFKTTINQFVSCEETEINYHLLGLNQYIDEFIRVPLDQEQLLATVEKKEEDKTKEKPSVENNEETQAETNVPTVSNDREKNDNTVNDQEEKEEEEHSANPDGKGGQTSFGSIEQSEEIEGHSK